MAKVWHTIFIKDKINIIVISDLVYIKDIPHIKISFPKEYLPLTVPIDAEKLQVSHGANDCFSYQLPIVLPDTFYERVKSLKAQKPQI